MNDGQLLVVNVNEKPYTMSIFEDGKLVRKIDDLQKKLLLYYYY